MGQRKVVDVDILATVVIFWRSDGDGVTKPAVHIGCSVLIEDRERPEHFLLVQETKPGKIGLFGLPGGGLELGEPLVDCARREVIEESGLERVVLGGILKIYQRPATEKGHNHSTLVFVARSYHGVPTPSHEHPRVEFFSARQIETMHTARELRSAIPALAVRRYLDGNRQVYPLDFVSVCGPQVGIPPITDPRTILAVGASQL